MFSRLMIAIATTVLTIVTSCLFPAVSLSKSAIAQVPGVYPFKLGDFTITVLSDGTLLQDPHTLLSNTNPTETDRLLQKNFLTNPVEASINAFSIDTGDQQVLVDTGAGNFLGSKLGGKLQTSLKAAGYTPNEIDAILLTHISYRSQWGAGRSWSTGIGRATAIAFGAAGAKVVFSDIRSVEGEETADLIRETGAECLFVKSDVSSEADVRELVQKAITPLSFANATYGKLDCAFNNAGIDLVVTPLHEQSIKDFDKIMSVNARRLFICMKYEIQQMLTQGAGAIVNNSSTNGLVALPGISPYVASKHAVMGLTRLAALDYAKQGIRINAVNPGPIATDLMARSADQMGITFDDLGSMVPMGRIGQATEIAQVVMSLCSDAASYITGQPLAIDGGYTAS